MAAPILTTKLFIPPLRPDLLRRSDLIAKLQASSAYPLTLVSASAGSGKTTILSEWAVESRRPVAWISLDSSDNDPVQFITYLICAIQRFRDGFGQGILESLQSTQPAPFDTLLVDLVNEAAELPENFSLIFDDYHVITDPRTNEAIVFLIDHQPPQMHLVFASRIDPPWPLARYRARNQIYELRGQDLRFSVNETAEFLNRILDMNLSTEQTKALEERTEGWIAGLQLAALSMQGRQDMAGFIKDFTGSHLYIAEYLVEEILRGQPEEIQSFLLKTAPLERLNAGLCEAVSGCQDGQTILKSLHRSNVFVIHLDQEGRWFRYHHLFADLLQARLQQNSSTEQIAALHMRAANWFEQHGYIDEAVTHAIKAKNFEEAAGLMARTARSQIFSGRVKTLRDWLNAFPEASFQTHPSLRFYLFWIDILQNRADLSDRSIREMEILLNTLPSTSENDRLRGELMAVVCRAVALSGRTAEGIRLAKKALAYLPSDDLSSRARVNSALATAHDLEGRPGEAGPAYQKAVSQAIAARDLRLAAHTLMVKGLAQCHYGRLHEAADTFQTIIDMGRQGNASPGDQVRGASTRNANTSKRFYPAGQGFIGLGSIYLEWNDLVSAENYLAQGLELCQRGGLDGIFVGQVHRSRLRQAKGDLEGALDEIRPHEQVQRVDDFNIATRHIQIGLAKGDIESARQWAAPLVRMLDSQTGTERLPLLFLENLESIVARVYLAGGKIQETLQILDRLQITAEPADRQGRLIEVYMLKALAYQQKNNGKVTPEAYESIVQALKMGMAEGYVLLFLEEGSALIPLLQAVAGSQTAGDRIKEYARKLLDAFGESGTPSSPKPRVKADELVHQLTPREMEVLTLIAAGDSNREIAEKLVITVRTVKKHTSNIYGKLNVSSRTQAVAYASEIGLLSKD